VLSISPRGALQQETSAPAAPVVPRDVPRGLVCPAKPPLTSRGGGGGADGSSSDSKLELDVDTTAATLFAGCLGAIANSGSNVPAGCFLWECISPVASDGVPQISAS
jgi:hypothetical protein